VPQGHADVSIILNRCKCDLILPCPVTMEVKLWVMFILIFNLPATTGNHSFVFFPFVVWSHSDCHFPTLISLSSLITTLVGTFSWHSLMSGFVAASFASGSGSSCSLDPDVRLDPAELNFSVCFFHLRQFPSYFFNEECVDIVNFK
jgi:hypothetical protein